ncbi:MAG: hypothetical protein KTR13_03480 [Saprospiraceae bacterium]|nr:hypothetical protein [Saprospiraceae bacterium]
MMKRYTLSFVALFVSVMSLAQVDDDSPVPPSEDVIIVESTEDAPAPVLSGIARSEKAYEVASDSLQLATEAYNLARQEYKEAENALQQARIDYRNARRDLNQAKKNENPIQIDRYVVNVNPVLQEMSRGTQYGYSTFLEGSEKGGVLNVLSKNAESEFKKYFSGYVSDKVKRQKGELYFDDILIPQVSSTTMDVFVDFVKESNGVNMLTYFNMGDRFLNGTEVSGADEEVRQLLDTFARNMRYMELERELKEQEKELEKIQKDVERSQKAAIKSREAINAEEQAIAQAVAEEEASEILLEQQLDIIELTRLRLQKVN